MGGEGGREGGRMRTAAAAAAAAAAVGEWRKRRRVEELRFIFLYREERGRSVMSKTIVNGNNIGRTKEAREKGEESQKVKRVADEKCPKAIRRGIFHSDRPFRPSPSTHNTHRHVTTGLSQGHTRF